MFQYFFLMSTFFFCKDIIMARVMGLIKSDSLPRSSFIMTGKLATQRNKNGHIRTYVYYPNILFWIHIIFFQENFIALQYYWSNSHMSFSTLVCTTHAHSQ